MPWQPVSNPNFDVSISCLECTEKILALLAFRIWHVDHQRAQLVEEAAGSRLTPVVRIILESGAINAATLFAFVMTLSFGSQGLEVMSEMVCVPFWHRPPQLPEYLS